MYTKIIKIFPVLLIIFSFFSCGEKKQEGKRVSQQDNVVALAYSIGGPGDSGFNDLAQQGIKRANNELKINYRTFEKKENFDKITVIDSLAQTNAQLIIGIGFEYSNAIYEVGKKYPDKKFACIDYQYNEDVSQNTVGIKFREDEGSFLVGAIAGLKTKSNIIGFLGGMESSLIKKFENGFIEGVKHVNPKAKILIDYIGKTPEAFILPSKGQEISLEQYRKGADIIFHAAGLSGRGIFISARITKKLGIGVDVDQYSMAPGYVLTSMLKKVDVAVFETIKSAVDKTFSGGIKVYGLKEGGIDFVYNENNKELITEKTYNEVQQIKQKIMNGEIEVK
jgi:basic membrane protein A